MVVGWCSQWWDVVDQEGIWGAVGLERRLRGVGDIVVQEELRCCWSQEEVEGSRSIKSKIRCCISGEEMRCCWSGEEVKGKRSVKSKIRHCWLGGNAMLPVWRGTQREEGDFRWDIAGPEASLTGGVCRWRQNVGQEGNKPVKKNLCPPSRVREYKSKVIKNRQANKSRRQRSNRKRPTTISPTMPYSSHTQFQLVN